MTERRVAIHRLDHALERLTHARSWLSDPAIDLWRTVEALTEVRDEVEATLEKLKSVSREALRTALDS